MPAKLETKDRSGPVYLRSMRDVLARATSLFVLGLVLYACTAAARGHGADRWMHLLAITAPGLSALLLGRWICYADLGPSSITGRTPQLLRIVALVGLSLGLLVCAVLGPIQALGLSWSSGSLPPLELISNAAVVLMEAGVVVFMLPLACAAFAVWSLRA